MGGWVGGGGGKGQGGERGAAVGNGEDQRIQSFKLAKMMRRNGMGKLEKQRGILTKLVMNGNTCKKYKAAERF